MRNLIIYIFIIVLFNSCNLEEINPEVQEIEVEDLVIASDFNFETTKDINIEIVIYDFQSKPLKNVLITFFNTDPNKGGTKLLTGITDYSGKFKSEVNIPSDITELFLHTEYIGMPLEHLISLKNDRVEYIINLSDQSNFSNSRLATSNDLPTRKKQTAENFTYLGEWTNKGVPKYLEPENDVIPSELLEDINSSLPETRPVPRYNPEYLKDEIGTNTILKEEADVWVTFVHEGAGYTNSLGYYKYELGNEPGSVENIDSLFIVFPNVSYGRNGLYPGNKVHLGRFPANTGIGWFLIPNGWNNSSKSVVSHPETKFSSKHLNTYTNEEFRQHTVLLKDDAREILLLGMEDITRPSGDNDFNDAVFYISANPYTALVTEDLEQTTSELDDSDGDDVPDHLDEYPEDPLLAFNEYYPAENIYGSLAFEDLWPTKGDYDFNDLVIDYNYHLVSNSKREPVQLLCKYKLWASVAYYKNAFGFEMPLVDNEDVVSLSGIINTENFIEYSANGLEAGQKKPVVILFDNAKKVLPQGNENFGKIEALLKFKSGLERMPLSSKTFNHFMIPNGQREAEIHLPGYQPTAKANPELFQTNDDNSSVENGYYKTTRNFPWAINIPISFNFPNENTTITKGYLKFHEWAESSGQTYPDWFRNEPTYRNKSKLSKDE
ncbi:LruC domain-containing protein [Flexithrix dorotheae]|uniref:LruC domain-containing protein n=1 Tax=Flexithrix dorotheae TaxID=70993 RepID=UPI00036D3E29|nr:LruC domain-containing protein [Flexithrix dorotheae]